MKRGRHAPSGALIHPVYSSPREFRRVFLLSFWLHAFLVAILGMYLPTAWVWFIAAFGAVVWVWSVLAAARAFDYLASNHFHRICFSGCAVAYSMFGFVGACYWAFNGNPLLLAISMGWGCLSILATILIGIHRGVLAQESQPRKSLKSVDWVTSTYDVATNSLDALDVNAAIVESLPTWRLFAAIGIILSPGPVIGVMAGKISDQARHIVAIPAFWGLAMFCSYLLIRVAIDYRVVRKIEIEKGIRIILSTSPLART